MSYETERGRSVSPTVQETTNPQRGGTNARNEAEGGAFITSGFDAGQFGGKIVEGAKDLGRGITSSLVEQSGLAPG